MARVVEFEEANRLQSLCELPYAVIEQEMKYVIHGPHLILNSLQFLDDVRRESGREASRRKR